jgi:hypothetical protein
MIPKSPYRRNRLAPRCPLLALCVTLVGFRSRLHADGNQTSQNLYYRFVFDDEVHPRLFSDAPIRKLVYGLFHEPRFDHSPN